MCFVVVASGEASAPTGGPGVAADAGPRTGMAVVTATGASTYAIRRGGTGGVGSWWRVSVPVASMGCGRRS
jgi:hypothetical protein